MWLSLGARIISCDQYTRRQGSLLCDACMCFRKVACLLTTCHWMPLVAEVNAAACAPPGAVWPPVECDVGAGESNVRPGSVAVWRRGRQRFAIDCDSSRCTMQDRSQTRVIYCVLLMLQVCLAAQKPCPSSPKHTSRLQTSDCLWGPTSPCAARTQERCWAMLLLWVQWFGCCTCVWHELLK